MYRNETFVQYEIIDHPRKHMWYGYFCMRHLSSLWFHLIVSVTSVHRIHAPNSNNLSNSEKPSISVISLATAGVRVCSCKQLWCVTNLPALKRDVGHVSETQSKHSSKRASRSAKYLLVRIVIEPKKLELPTHTRLRPGA
jgi:hypothetical protein